MKRLFMAFVALIFCLCASAADTYKVTVAYDGNKATVSIPSEVASYVSCQSGTSAHVKLIQSSTTTANPGEIIYELSGQTSDGEFYMEGEYKATLILNGLDLTNPDSTAIQIKNGKRIKVSLSTDTENTLVDGAKNADSKGCFHCKGHTEFVGKGKLSVTSNIRHGIYSKEYVTVKNCTINVIAAVKDGIHCQEYFLMQSGTINIGTVQDDGIQVEVKDAENRTGTTTDHEDEDSGNFYMTGGTLKITSVVDKCIKADGTISMTGGTQDFDKTNILENASTGIDAPTQLKDNGNEAVYDLSGRRLPKEALPSKGIFIINGKKVIR